MDIRGLQKTTLLDFPGKIACTIFLSGCNFRCPFCYNGDLVLHPKNLPRITEEEIFLFLKKRQNVLDGVVVCGGEPTLQPGLQDFVKRIKKEQFLVKLDTNGSRSQVLEEMLAADLLDFVSMDIKAPLNAKDYGKVTGLSDFDTKIGLDSIFRSVENLTVSGVDFELRTTVVPGLHDKDILAQIGSDLKEMFSGFQRDLDSEKVLWFLQKFVPKKCIDPDFDDIEPFEKEKMHEILDHVRKIISSVKLRGVA